MSAEVRCSAPAERFPFRGGLRRGQPHRPRFSLRIWLPPASSLSDSRELPISNESSLFIFLNSLHFASVFFYNFLHHRVPSGCAFSSVVLRGRRVFPISNSFLKNHASIAICSNSSYVKTFSLPGNGPGNVGRQGIGREKRSRASAPSNFGSLSRTRPQSTAGCQQCESSGVREDRGERPQAERSC